MTSTRHARRFSAIFIPNEEGSNHFTFQAEDSRRISQLIVLINRASQSSRVANASVRNQVSGAYSIRLFRDGFATFFGFRFMFSIFYIFCLVNASHASDLGFCFYSWCPLKVRFMVRNRSGAKCKSQVTVIFLTSIIHAPRAISTMIRGIYRSLPVSTRTRLIVSNYVGIYKLFRYKFFYHYFFLFLYGYHCAENR